MLVKLALAVLAAAALAVSAGAVATAGDGKGHNKHVEVLDLTSRTIQQTDLDLGAEGPSQGDRFVFRDELLRDGERVGENGGECVFVRLAADDPSATINCVATASLPGGTITVQGLVTATEESTGPFVFAITGGTGRYRTAHGEVTLTFTDETTSQLHLEIITRHKH
jgi:hypothetical protein